MKRSMFFGGAAMALLAIGASAQDPMSFGLKHLRVLAEDGSVRVLEYAPQPGDKTPMHSHPASVVYVVQGGRVRYTFPDGSSKEATLKSGDTMLRPPLSHADEAIDPVRSILVELAPPGNPLVGAWRLVGIETVRANGAIIYPYYGKHPEGLIVYDASGWMSVQIASDPKPVLPKGNTRDEFLKAPPSQKARAADGYYAHYGPYTVDMAKSTVTHHVRDALLPGERGQDFLRQYSIDNGRLTLLAHVHEMGEEHVRRLVWQKIAPPEAH